MANTITDNRTLVNSADVVGTVWVDIAGSAASTPDTEIKIQGAASMGTYCTTTRDGRFYRYASDQNLANTHAYIWVNCGIVGLLATKASQGLTFRARGPTITNYLEWDLAGSDSWPTAVAGGWVQFVVDLSSTPTRTGGTPPATTAIRELGVTFITASVMPRMADNTWVDEIRTLADGTPGIIVQGRNGGSTDWKWTDLPTQLGSTVGTARNGPAGTVVLNTPVQFFVDDATTHAFSSTNETVLWDTQEFAASDLYKITVLGAASGTANWKMGAKTGSGINASGAQGGSIVAASTGVRWDFDADIANIDSCNFYGSSLIHGGDFQLDTSTNEVISTLFIDSTTVEATNSNAFLKNSYVSSNTAVDNGALIWNENVDVDGILDGSTFSKGTNAHHAIDFGTAVTSDITLRNCSFNGFGTTEDGNDATLRFLATTGSLNCNLIGCTVDGATATAANLFKDDAAGIAVTLVFDPVTTLINIKDPDGNDEQNVRVYLEASDGTGDLPYQQSITSITRSTFTAEVTFGSAHGLNNGEYLKLYGITNVNRQEDLSGAFQVTVTSPTVLTYQTTDSGDTSYTGTLTGTGATIYGLTDASGNISSSRTYSNPQPLVGYARKEDDGVNYFKTIELVDTVNTSTGLTINRRLVSDGLV